LTEQNLTNYSTNMDAEINSLEIKLGALLTQYRTLQMENQRLRQHVAVVNDQNKQLKDRVEQASERLAVLLDNLPEDA